MIEIKSMSRKIKTHIVDHGRRMSRKVMICKGSSSIGGLYRVSTILKIHSMDKDSVSKRLSFLEAKGWNNECVRRKKRFTKLIAKYLSRVVYMIFMIIATVKRRRSMRDWYHQK